MFYIQLAIYGASAPLIYLTFRETRGLVILSKRGRNADGLTEKASTDARPLGAVAKEFINGNIIRPFQLLCTEPVVFVFTLLSALSYGVVFLSTQSVTQVYAANYDWKDYQSGLLQASIIVGEFAGFLACLVQNKIYARAAATHLRKPNTRLPEA